MRLVVARLGLARGCLRALWPLLAFSAASSDVLARSPPKPWNTPVEVIGVGPDPVRVRVSDGVVLPCDSMDDKALIAGRFRPGESARAVAFGACVCVQQTYAPFPDTDWSPPVQACTACNYNVHTRVWTCPPLSPDPTIQIKVSSARPRAR